MTTASPAGGNPCGHRTGADTAGQHTRRLTTETKSALKTTEFFITSPGTEDGHADYFRAD